MAFVQLDFFSECLNMYTAVNVALPMPLGAGANPLPCLTLLHDRGEDMTAWQRGAAVERYALKYGVAILMPDGALSYYENMRHGGRYADYIAEELPKLARMYLHLSEDWEQNFIAGCGMGGTGAMKLYSQHAERYAAAGAFSAAHIQGAPENDMERAALYRAYGDDAESYRLRIEQGFSAMGRGARLYHACAQPTPEIEKSRAFFEALDMDYRYERFSGKDDWETRAQMLNGFLAYLKLPAPEEKLK